MNRLKELRIKNNLLSNEMANILHVNVKTYYNYENGNSKLTEDMICFISKYFNVSSDYLLGIKDYNILDSYEEIERLNIINAFKGLNNKQDTF